VWDYTHNESRGYGKILAAAPPAADGNLRWKVDFESGQRASAIQQRYLDLSYIHHDQREAPSGLQQRILVVVGKHKGKEGVTVKKVGAVLRAAAGLAASKRQAVRLLCSWCSGCRQGAGGAAAAHTLSLGLPSHRHPATYPPTTHHPPTHLATVVWHQMDLRPGRDGAV
jgi:hypothetical protein